jgi:hypothetical protein
MHTETILERAEELAERILPERTPKRRMLVIVNPYARTVSDRLAIFNRSYLLDPPVVRVTAGDRTLTGVTVVVQNSDTFTCFRRDPIRVAEPAGLETGSLSVAVLKRATPLQLPTLIPRVLSTRARPVLRHRQVEWLPDLQTFHVDVGMIARSRSGWTAITSASSSRCGTGSSRAACWRWRERGQGEGPLALPRGLRHGGRAALMPPCARARSRTPLFG